jgi:DNA-binding transcriptional regulator YiaG
MEREASIPRLGTALAVLRTRANVRQREMATRLGMSQGHLSALETGRLRLPPQLASVYVRELRSHLKEQLVRTQDLLAQIEAMASSAAGETKH